MWDDAFPSSHPIAVEATSPAQITALFDSVTYKKGSGKTRNCFPIFHFHVAIRSFFFVCTTVILSMLEAIVSENELKTGLKVCY
jgi:hypothetical protein